jgi:hypothetical protein
MEYKAIFPKDLDSFKRFVEEHLFNIGYINDEICQSIIDKVNNEDFSFTLQEIQLMQKISSIGDVCTCDTAHRIGMDGRKCAISEV